jgi:hypothetical protein
LVWAVPRSGPSSTALALPDSKSELVSTGDDAVVDGGDGLAEMMQQIEDATDKPAQYEASPRKTSCCECFRRRKRAYVAAVGSDEMASVLKQLEDEGLAE